MRDAERPNKSSHAGRGKQGNRGLKSSLLPSGVRCMKIVLPGGSGQVGMVLCRAFVADGHEVVVLSRKPGKAPWRVVEWDAATLGPWVAELEGATAVINLAGRSVNCRYNAEN